MKKSFEQKKSFCWHVALLDKRLKEIKAFVSIRSDLLKENVHTTQPFKGR